jgi:hypothetical protein
MLPCHVVIEHYVKNNAGFTYYKLNKLQHRVSRSEGPPNTRKNVTHETTQQYLPKLG